MRFHRVYASPTMIDVEITDYVMKNVGFVLILIETFQWEVNL